MPPSPRSTIEGSAARTVLNTPVRLMSTISFHCCAVISQTTAQVPMPAFAQTMSICPSSARPASHGLLHLRERADICDGFDRPTTGRLDLCDGLVEIGLGGQRIGQGLQRVRADIDRDHVRTFSGQPHSVRAALSTAGPGDQRNFSFDESHRFVLPFAACGFPAARPATADG